ncbi:coiled-coil domain-containing protein 83 isoform X2 [Tyto alba]|nr:coiled-coil domain-containing protein 83 isoform X2 [Tyto alba]XP_042647914.1 coiled-coil domain-containing protein 83 isoform X2 [Tyto alba]XP_042647915.1 coiled-coil domain-containing protein 83 isoform X2 [Tyto alba]XP_042647916.1 coiled-coil domain-containing protein 83 isoform X2 [Tyto alba]
MEEKKKEEKPEEQLTEPESAVPEALLEFQIETKEAAIDCVLSNLKQLKKRNKEYHERNDILKEEQQARIRHILRQKKEKEKEQDEKEVVTKDNVEESLKAKWQYVKDQEQLLKDLHFQIEETGQRFLEKQAERDYWLEYKNVGSKEQANKIMNLEKDIKEVKDDLHRTTEYYRNALKAVKKENDRMLEMHMRLSKEQAPENAVRYLDKNSCREIEENEWLKEEIKIYQKEVSDLKASIQLLEEENISLVTKLIDVRLQNLRVPRHLFLTQAADLQDEFPKEEMKELEYKEYAAKADGDESLRSATVPCQKNKAFAKIQSKTEKEKYQDSDEEPREKSFTPTLDSLLYEDEKVFQEYLKLGPLETNLIVVGRAMPIHKEPEEMPGRSHTEDGIIGKSDGHITAQMIKALSKEKFG